ncbi:CBS domain-containing protein [Nonomuraea sp. NPDC046802]|uniref:CBS domain-containing protein n=1 Tax=Nonomuraea sp. NPDC046802 TaxID=3154919 RepID=UPI00340BFB2D
MPIEVKDIMGPVAVAVVEDASFAEIMAAMRRFAVGAVTVIDAQRRPVGVVSEDDLLLKETAPAQPKRAIFDSRRRRREHHKAAGMTAAQLMSSPAITVTPQTLAREAAQRMHDGRVKQLPVIDAATGRIIGTLHQRDVLRVFSRPVEELRADVRAVLPDPDAFPFEVDQGVVKIGGMVERRSQAVVLAERIRGIEGVVDVRSYIAFSQDDLLDFPSPT